MKNLLIKLVASLLFITSLQVFGIEKSSTVNVLTWWGYLDDPKTATLIHEKCGANLSYDNYKSNDDMLRRWHKNSDKYDLLIFSDTIYNVIKNQIILKHSNLWKNSVSYHPVIKRKYQDSHLPNNVVFFAHSLTGFIWNPNVVQLSEMDTVQAAFKKAKNNKVILLDDPAEINMLLTSSGNHTNSDNNISLEDFHKLAQETKIYISNEVNRIYSQKDFAFSFGWSGVAFSKKLPNKNTKFLINEHLSYISTDFLAQLKDTHVAACAANVLASRHFASMMQNKSRYFSPYGNIDSVNEGEFKGVYKNFLLNIEKLHWLTPPSSEKIRQLNQAWDEVKYELSKNS